MDILFIHPKKEIRDMVAFSLESELSATVHPVDSFHEAFDYLVEDNPVNVIVCEDNEPNVKLYKYLLSVESEIPLILIGGPGDAGHAKTFPDLKIVGRANPNDLIESLRKILISALAKGEISARAADSEYCRIQTELLAKVIPLQADIYIRLSEIKYVKVFQQGDVFNSGDLERYLNQKKVTHLYLRKEDCAEFITKFKVALAGILGRDTANQNSILQLAESVHEAVVELGSKMGFTTEVQGLVAENVQTVIKSIRKDRELAKIFAGFKEGSDRYISSHSVMLAHVACCFASRLTWHSNSTFEKLSFAAFLHDITLKNNALARMETIEEITASKARFTQNEIREYLNHPAEAVALGSKFESIPADVDMIVMQHHERPDGSGFPKKLDSRRIAPLSCVFIIAHDFLNLYLKNKNLELCMAILRKRYDSGSFRKIMDAIAAPELGGARALEVRGSSDDNSGESA